MSEKTQLSTRTLVASRSATYDEHRGEEVVVDVLSDVLSVAGAGSALLGCRKMLAPWGLEVTPSFQASIHFVRRGSCWLQLKAEAPRRLSEGDLLLLGPGVAHVLKDAPNRPARPYEEVIAEMDRRARKATPRQLDDACEVLCAKYSFDASQTHPFVSGLPTLVHLTTDEVSGQRQLSHLLDALYLEAASPGEGSTLIVPRLVDTLLVLILRAQMRLRDTASTRPSLCVALRDPGISRALKLIHEQPNHAWTVGALAQGAAKSRATFARRFTQLVGEPPAAYLARWRMCVAGKALRESNQSVDDIAYAVGYESGAAFCKAFKRTFGLSPARWRRAVRDSATESSALPALPAERIAS